MFGYSVPSVINHSITVEDDINPPAGSFTTTVDNEPALDGFGIGSGGIGVRGRAVGGHGIDGSVQGAGIGVYGSGTPDDSIAMYADSEGANGIGILCSASQPTSAAIAIRGKIRLNQAAVHVLGSYSGKGIPVYEDGGVLIGYIPVYA